MDLPPLGGLEDVADLLSLRARVSTHLGDHAATARPLRRMIGLADAVDADAHMLTPHLVALNIDRATADEIVRIAPHLSVGDGPGRLPADEARELVALLTDDAPRRAGLRRAVRGEVLLQQNAIDHAMDGAELNFGGTPPAIMRPFLPANGVVLAELMLPMLAVADLDSLPAGRETLDEFARRSREFESKGFRYAPAKTLVAFVDVGVLAHFLAANARRLAAVSLAVALYRADHNGELPPALDALVPDYLPRVPADALTADGRVRYDPARGIAWTVGDNARDDGGRTADDLTREDPSISTAEVERIGVDEVVRLLPVEVEAR